LYEKSVHGQREIGAILKVTKLKTLWGGRPRYKFYPMNDIDSEHVQYRRRKFLRQYS